jgi:hypothetical protein
MADGSPCARRTIAFHRIPSHFSRAHAPVSATSICIEGFALTAGIPPSLADTFPADRVAQRSGWIFVLLVAAYFVLQTISRVVLSASLELDEAEQVFVFQRLQLGYDTQPPLYAWLQWLMFSVFGVNLFALSAFKNLLLFATYYGMYRLARPLIGTAGAIVAAASLILFPQIAWESQRDLTHSVLLAAIASLTLWCYFALLRNPGAVRYALLGLLIGLGLQSKYNFAMFAGGVAVASLLVPEHRRIVWNRKIAVALAVAALCLLPHGLWLLDHFGTAAGGTLHKMQEGVDDGGYLRNVGRGLRSMLTAALAFLTPMWIVYGLAARRCMRQAATGWRNPDARFFVWLYAACFAAMIALVLTGEVGKIKDRWMQPLLFSVPLAFFLLLPACANAVVHRRILRVAAAFAVLILLALPLRTEVGRLLGRQVRTHLPYPELAAQIARRFPQAGVVVAGDRQSAGNLFFQRPSLPTRLFDDLLARPQPLAGEALLLVRSEDAAGMAARWRAAYPSDTVVEQGRIDLPYRSGGAEFMSFDYALIRAGSK